MINAEHLTTKAGDPDKAQQISRKSVVTVNHLRKVYGSTVAVDEVSFSIAEGEVFGIIGPNGAGKIQHSRVYFGASCSRRGFRLCLWTKPQE